MAGRPYASYLVQDPMGSGQTAIISPLTTASADSTQAASTSGPDSAVSSSIPSAMIGVGGSFLAQYMAQRAAEAKQAKELEMRQRELQAKQQSDAMNNIMSVYGKILRR